MEYVKSSDSVKYNNFIKTIWHYVKNSDDDALVGGYIKKNKEGIISGAGKIKIEEFLIRIIKKSALLIFLKN
jgi:hypothetical protein